MEKATVIKLRELFKSTGFIITGDNMKLIEYDSDNKDQELLWDDANEILYAITTTTRYDVQRTRPVSILAVPYEMIQYFNSSMSVDDFKNTTDKIKSEVKTYRGSVDDIVQKFKDMWQK